MAGYLGLISLLVWVLGPVAIGIGLWALAVSARPGGATPRRRGRGRAVFAIVCGTAATAVLVALSTHG